MPLSTDPPPAPDSPGARAGSRRARRLTITIAVAVAALLGAYSAVIASAGVPDPVASLDVEAEQSIDADATPAQEIVDADPLPAAVGWLDGDAVWSNDDDPHPLASITKLVTVLVCLEEQPLDSGSDGPTHAWTSDDEARQEDILARDGVAFPIPVGTEVTARQMLTLALVPSANDFAAAYATSVFGDDAAFLEAAESWTKRQGLDSIEIFEPTGLDERNVATTADVVRLARLALENETVAEIVRMPSATLPWGIGEVESTNPLFGVLPEVLGVKTGATDIAGFNLAAAQAGDVDGRAVVKIAVVFGRASDADRASAGAGLLTTMDALPQQTEVVGAEERIGTLTTVDGRRIPLVAAEPASSTLLPGERADRTVAVQGVAPGEAGRDAGELRITDPASEREVPVLTGGSFEKPDFWWRFWHPGEVLFG